MGAGKDACSGDNVLRVPSSSMLLAARTRAARRRTRNLRADIAATCNAIDGVRSKPPARPGSLPAPVRQSGFVAKRLSLNDKRNGRLRPRLWENTIAVGSWGSVRFGAIVTSFQTSLRASRSARQILTAPGSNVSTKLLIPASVA